jgi:hypothetical protein
MLRFKNSLCVLYFDFCWLKLIFIELRRLKLRKFRNLTFNSASKLLLLLASRFINFLLIFSWIIKGLFIVHNIIELFVIIIIEQILVVLEILLLDFFISVDHIIVVHFHVIVLWVYSLMLVEIRSEIILIPKVSNSLFCHIARNYISWIWSILKSLSIPQSVKSMISRTFPRINASNHYDSWLIFISHEWVSKYHC